MIVKKTNMLQCCFDLESYAKHEISIGDMNKFSFIKRVIYNEKAYGKV